MILLFAIKESICCFLISCLKLFNFSLWFNCIYYCLFYIIISSSYLLSNINIHRLFYHQENLILYSLSLILLNLLFELSSWEYHPHSLKTISHIHIIKASGYSSTELWSTKCGKTKEPVKNISRILLISIRKIPSTTWKFINSEKIMTSN